MSGMMTEAIARYSSISKGYQEMIEYVKSKLLQKIKRDSSANERRVAQRER
jgi:cytochrome b